MQHRSILVVDDEKNVRFTVSHALQNEGYDVDAASSGVQGLQKTALKEYDLLLVDLRMPGMTGLEMLREIRRQSRELPAVIITAYGNPQQLVEAAQLGAIDFVRKPFSIQSIRSIVRGVIDTATSQYDVPPRDAGGQLRAGKKAMMLGHIEEARSFLRDSIVSDGEHPEAVILLGVCDLLSGEREEAARHFRRALQIDPSSRTASEYLTWIETQPS